MKTSYIAAGGLALVLVLWMASGLLASDTESNDNSTDNAEQNNEQDDSAAVMKVEYIDVNLSPKSRDIVLQGQLQPSRQLQLRTETGSTVDTIPVTKGQRVNKGDTIVQLALQGRDSDLAEARAQLQSAQSQQTAAESLRQKGLQSQVELERSSAQLATARAQIDRIQRDITNTKIVAPFDGVINALPLEVGEMVERGAQIAELVDNSSFVVSAQVAQQTLKQLKLGNAIDVKLITGEILPGEITFISSVADSSSRSFTVEAKVENEGGQYSAGVSASLIIPVEQVEAVFLSPSALSLGDDGDLGVKLVDEQNLVVFTPIRLVSSSLEGAWVTGIEDNSRVITLGQGFVKPGQEVEPVKAPEAADEAS